MPKISISSKIENEGKLMSSRCSSEHSLKKDTYPVLKKPTLIEIENVDDTGSPLRIVN